MHREVLSLFKLRGTIFPCLPENKPIKFYHNIYAIVLWLVTSNLEITCSIIESALACSLSNNNLALRSFVQTRIPRCVCVLKELDQLDQQQNSFAQIKGMRLEYKISKSNTSYH